MVGYYIPQCIKHQGRMFLFKFQYALLLVIFPWVVLSIENQSFHQPPDTAQINSNEQGSGPNKASRHNHSFLPTARLFRNILYHRQKTPERSPNARLRRSTAAPVFLWLNQAQDLPKLPPQARHKRPQAPTLFSSPSRLKSLFFARSHIYSHLAHWTLNLRVTFVCITTTR